MALNPVIMTKSAEVKMSKWGYVAFIASDLVLLGVAWFIYNQHARGPWNWMELGLMVFCGLAGAILAVTPFYLEYQGAVKMVETGAVVSMISQLEQLGKISTDIQGATALWQNVHESASKTAKSANEITDKMMVEVANFTKFMQESSDGERATFRLEIDKLRREQHEFIQIIVRMLDHTYALQQAAVRSGQQGLIENLSSFQAANRDVARRIGLVPFAPSVNEPFDPKVHQSAESQSIPESNARIVETIATGYTYQGALLRPALVSLQSAAVLPVVEKEKQVETKVEAAPSKLEAPGSSEAIVRPDPVPPVVSVAPDIHKPVAKETKEEAKVESRPQPPTKPVKQAPAKSTLEQDLL